MTKPIPDVLDEPVWYEPLRSPSWLMPPVRDDAPRVVFEAAPPPDDDARLRGVRTGLPLFLAEAVRFVSDATTAAVVSDEGDAGSAVAYVRTALEDDGREPAIVVDVRDVRGGTVGDVRRAVPDDSSLESVIGTLPAAVAVALAPVGVRPVWSTVYVPPPSGHAAEQVRGHAVCAWLRQPDLHRIDPSTDADEAARRRAAVTAGLTRLAELAGRSASPFNAFLLFAGLMAVRDAGSGVYLDFRLQANALCMNATDPRDPVFRMSVLVLRALGDPEIAGRRRRSLGTEDPALTSWLTRTEAVS